ncbi:hypothetical protein FRB97_000135 [Tulasnella sp. 331]|nr:hypothetical protein FRB97_000135 [Tulasnella sp. 331]KAG8890855.1 hypothetical protein FRB98_004900 [Tulasnella sp. 332]
MSTHDVVEAYKETLASREKHIKETWIGAMEARIVREELIKCQRAEGVNHYAECKNLAEMYLRMMKTSKVTGYKQIDLS